MPNQNPTKAQLIKDHHDLADLPNSVGVWDWNLVNQEIFWNDSMFALYQVKRENFTGTVDTWENTLHPADSERAKQEMQAALDGEKPFDTEFRVCWSNGEVRHIKTLATVFRDANGKPNRMLGTSTDITEQRNAERTEEQLRFVLEGAQLGFWDWNIASGKVERNARWATMLGFTYEEIQLTTKQWSDFLHPDDSEQAWGSIMAVLEGRSPIHRAEYRMLHKDGGFRWILDQANVMERDSDGKPQRMCGIHTDITERKLLEEELKRQAHIDYLTEASNRGHFMQQAELELARAIRYANDLSILMLDIDHFKLINDLHGHKVGDTVLKKLVSVCQTTLRTVDILGRMGGEEFAILLPETNLVEALEVAERLRLAIAATLVPLEGGLPVQLTVSIGVTSLATSDDNIDVLLNAADKALYAAKHEGRNKVCVTGQ